MLIEVRDLTKYFPARRAVWQRLRGRPVEVLRAVEGVSFTVGEGEVLGLVGESGCGKTTLARTVVGLCPATAGEVRFAGRDVLAARGREARTIRRALQIVFQDAGTALDPRFTMRRALEEPLVVHGCPSGERRDRVVAALERTNLSANLLDRRPAELSGGQRQRLCIARAIVLEPRFLVLDEPLAGLDASVKAQILGLLMELRARLGLAYLLISHDLETTFYAADRVAVMYRGRLVEEFPAAAGPGAACHPYTLALLADYQGESVDPGGSLVPAWQEEMSVGAPAAGCGYRDRCRLARPLCGESRPALRPLANGHRLACHFL